MSEQEIKVGDTVRLLIDLGGQSGRVAEVVEVFERAGLKFYDVSVNGSVTGVAAYEVEKIAAVQEVVSTLEELEELPGDTSIWSASNDGTRAYPAGTGKPYLKLGIRNESRASVWHSYADGGTREGHEIQLPAVVVYKPVAEIVESVKD